MAGMETRAPVLAGGPSGGLHTVPENDMGTVFEMATSRKNKVLTFYPCRDRIRPLQLVRSFLDTTPQILPMVEMHPQSVPNGITA